RIIVRYMSMKTSGARATATSLTPTSTAPLARPNPSGMRPMSQLPAALENQITMKRRLKPIDQAMATARLATNERHPVRRSFGTRKMSERLLCRSMNKDDDAQANSPKPITAVASEPTTAEDASETI